ASHDDGTTLLRAAHSRDRVAKIEGDGERVERMKSPLPPRDFEREVELGMGIDGDALRSEEHTSELQSRFDLVCRLLLENKNGQQTRAHGDCRVLRMLISGRSQCRKHGQ